MATDTARKSTRSSASGSVQDLDVVAAGLDGPVPKVKKVASQPTADQLRMAARRARKAGIEPLARKYDKVAADAAKGEPKTAAEGRSPRSKRTRASLNAE